MVPSHSVSSLRLRSHRLAWPRTEPSQGSDTGSNPVGTTNLSPHLARRLRLSWYSEVFPDNPSIGQSIGQKCGVKGVHGFTELVIPSVTTV